MKPRSALFPKFFWLFSLLGWTLAVLVCLPNFAASSADQETILEFSSRIEIQADGALWVQETIVVQCLQQEIKRGIYRDFPTRYKDHRGRTRIVPFEVLSVQKDGVTEPYFTESVDKGIRTYIGSRDVRLEKGVYTYRLEYRTGRQLGFFQEHDELYWNVTGNDWSFPIADVRCTVRLPESVPSDQLRVEAYTGPRGAKGQDYTTLACGPGCMRFKGTRVLAPGEGLTIVLGWPKGVIPEPTAAQKRAEFVSDHLALVMGLAGALILLVYYLVVWWRVGRDPRPGVIMPRFLPPEKLSPGALRYIQQMRFDPQCLSSALIHLAVKGHLTIENKNQKYVLTKTKQTGIRPAPDEALLLRSLLGTQTRLELSNSNHKVFHAAQQALKKHYRQKYLKNYFLKNTAYLIPGLVFSGLTLLATLIVSGSALGFVAVFLMVWLTGWTAGVMALTGLVLKNWREHFRQPSAGSLVSALGISAFALPFWGGEIFGLAMLVFTASLELVAVWALLAVLTVVFHYLLKTPTRIGRLLLDKIEGFTLYLGRAEKDRLDLLHPPKKTPELFEKFLPYALALEVENRWAAQFDEILRASATGESTYQPLWYSGSTFNAQALGPSLGSGLANAFISSSRTPGSSSGGGGGGSSGGGGGGGGGGGW